MSRKFHTQGSAILKDHPNRLMRSLYVGPVNAVYRSTGSAVVVEAVQFYNSGCAYRISRASRPAGVHEQWIADRELSFS